MGSEEGDEDELPVHAVVIEGFEMMRSEVTVAHLTDCIDEGHCEEISGSWDSVATDGGDQRDMPVSHVSLQDARIVCDWLDARLPSEAEWEYAARSRGQDRRFPWGDEEPTSAHAVFHWSPGLLDAIRTWSVCDHPDGDSEQGICDLAGSVWEYVEDCYHEGYEVLDDHEDLVSAPDDGEPWTDECRYEGVVRGGSWASYPADELRSACRAAVEYETRRYSDVGFRCVK